MGRAAAGVKAIRLKPKDQVIAKVMVSIQRDRRPFSNNIKREHQLDLHDIERDICQALWCCDSIVT